MIDKWTGMSLAQIREARETPVTLGPAFQCSACRRVLPPRVVMLVRWPNGNVMDLCARCWRPVIKTVLNRNRSWS